MKKITFLAVFLMLNLIFGVQVIKAGSEIKSSLGGITIEELGVEETGILPSNPFYFFKRWKRDIQKTFTFDAIKKADLRFQIINEQAAEIKKLETVAPDRVESIIWTLGRYQSNADNFKDSLFNLNETAQNQKIDQLLDKILDRLIKHDIVFDEIKNKYKDNEDVQNEANDAEIKIYEIISVIPVKFESIEMFVDRLQENIETQIEISEKEQKIIDILSFVEDNIDKDGQEKIKVVKEKLIKNMEEEGSVDENLEIEIENEDGKNLNKRDNQGVCIQIIQPAISLEGECREFPTPCDVPKDWKKINKCADKNDKQNNSEQKIELE